MNKKLRVVIMVLLAIVLAGIILFPKIKPIFASGSEMPAPDREPEGQEDPEHDSCSMSADF